MKIEITEQEAHALIHIREMLRGAGTPVPEFLNWVADRLTMKFGDEEQVDFVQALRARARQIDNIANLLDIVRR